METGQANRDRGETQQRHLGVLKVGAVVCLAAFLFGFAMVPLYRVVCEQVLQAGESRRMPVRFFVDPRLPAGVGELTLSYTFYENEVATRRLAATGTPLPAAG